MILHSATLIRRPLSEYLRESEENFSPTAGRLRRKFYTIINHELQIDLIFLIAPLTYLAFTFIEMISSHPARQMCLRLETLLPLFQRATVLPTQWNVTLLIRSWSWSCWDEELEHSWMVITWKIIITLIHQANLSWPLLFLDQCTCFIQYSHPFLHFFLAYIVVKASFRMTFFRIKQRPLFLPKDSIIRMREEKREQK